ncbi:glucose 1-dehydrogenase [Enhydrobacter aerosaccus]|uniref:glucose 1-dehydrogenase n=1 Tax=Enhydrobacter aerosaccus TaxID=225324 RepID=UPI001C46E842|nr:glucose 1-dehydrogenase [Enhydrobacter aerosaccus]
MKAITVLPGTPASVQLDDRPEPRGTDDALLVQAIALGVCGTDREIISGAYGWAPPGKERLVLGHESLGRVIETPQNSGFDKGDIVVGIVRRPDPVPCPSCAVGEWDMCRNGLYTERGIKAVDGYGAERFPLEPQYAIKVDASLGSLAVLLEPASILAKAWDHIDRIGARTRSWSPRTVLVTGAGPVGLLGAVMAQQRGLEIHVMDLADSGPKPDLVRDLGGHYHARMLPEDFRADIVIECTGALPVLADVMHRVGSDGVVCLTGVSGSGHRLPFDFGAFNRHMVLSNNVTFGSVNANRAHYQAAAEALAKADRAWLSRLITRRVPLDRWQEAFQRQPGDIKVVLQFEPDAA